LRTLLHLNGMTGLSEEVNASPPQMSIERILNGIHWLGEVRFLSRLPNNRKDKDPAPTEETRRTCWDNKLNLKPKNEIDYVLRKMTLPKIGRTNSTPPSWYPPHIEW
jgi:hypothetical protein